MTNGKQAREDETRDRQLRYWRHQLSDASTSLALPMDGGRPAVQAGGRGVSKLIISEQLASGLRSLSARHGTSMSTTLIAAWSALLARWGGQPEVVVGTLVESAGNVSSGAAVVTPNMVALRVNLESDPSVSELLSQLRTTVLDASAHQDVTLEQVLTELQRPRTPGQCPLFQTTLTCNDAGRSASHCTEGGVALLPPAHGVTWLDLSFCTDHRNGRQELAGSLVYACELFEASTVTRWLRHFERLLEAMVEDDARRVSALPLLSEAERTLLLVDFNATEQAYPCDGLIHGLFEDQVELAPDAPAVVSESDQVSYAELNRRANRVAHRLLALGVKPDDRVAICVERGIEMVVGVLAILKAGGAYVPLDPAYPSDRLGYMFTDSRPVALLTQSHLQATVVAWLPAGSTVPVLAIDHVASQLIEQPEQNPRAHAGVLQASNLAYVIYTSGSTGQPKGVMVEHHSAVNFWHVLSRTTHAECAPRSRIGLNSAFSFDMSLKGLLQLLSGHCLVVIPQTVRASGPALMNFIERYRIDAFECTPSQLEVLLAAGLMDDVGHRPSSILLGGEPIGPALWTRLGQSRRIRFFNMYGPTECTVDATIGILSGSDDRPNIGRAIANVKVYLLDKHHEPVPLGVSGEIHIGGAGVARGYLDRPELTEERFIPDPFAPDAGGRMYKTGDLGRYRPDGSIEYLGRNDSQVKVRGFRIELGEIEARLRNHPGIREAVVMLREDCPGDARLVAYYVSDAMVSAEPRSVSAGELRQHLAGQLPSFMVPALYVALDRLPLTVNGKLDRAGLPAPGSGRPELAVAYAPPINPDEARLCIAFGEVLGMEGVGRLDNFFDLGGNSLLAVRLMTQVTEGDAAAGAATILFANPTPAMLAVALARCTEDTIESNRLSQARREATADQSTSAGSATANEPIAIIAMAGRFPGADDVEAFWDNLCAGKESITVFPADQLDPWIPVADRLDPAYVAARGVIDGVEYFDASFFGINPREAELMDPQHRIFLELCWECMERAGEVPEAATGPVGVFAGTYHSTYLRRHVAAHPDLVEKVGTYPVVLANEKDYIATRIAHKLNLTGPAISMYTACSTSLVAACQAMESLRAGSCDMALAGGSSIICPPRSGHLYQEGAMFSPDGHTRAFDANAQGTVFSDGAAVVLLKRLSDAIRDGNPVHAVILGGAVNNDGGGKASFTAPSSEGQAAVIAMAQVNAGVSARSISYLEAHGTGTPMGDPIEIEGLVKAFRRTTRESGFCRIGSLKSNVGHLVIAAGAAGIIKTALALEQGRIPASLHFDRANPAIDFAGSPFVVNDATSAWSSEGATPRRAGVSSFGVGGTNAHVVLEQAPPLPESKPASDPNLLVVSARSAAALTQAVGRLAVFLESSVQVDVGHGAQEPSAVTPLNLADVAWTLAIGRKAFAHRVAVVATDTQDAISQLRSVDTAAAIKRSHPARHCEAVFLFPGQGSHYAGMGRSLYASEPVFAAAFEQCVDALRSASDLDLRALVFSDDPAALLPTAVMQPAIFAIEYALARLWMSRGITPVAMIGHSIGEFVAATLAGVFELPDALRLVARRGALMQAQPAGSMLSIRIGLEALLPRLPSDVSLAAENAPAACVVAGPTALITAFQQVLEADGVACRALRTSHAFHSTMMDPVVAPFLAEVEALKLSAPALPLVSTATGEWLDADRAVSPHYWARHLREPVRFAAAVGQVLDSRSRVLLEVGPRATLTMLARQHPNLQQHRIAAMASLADAPAKEVTSFRMAAGQLWARGAGIDPTKFDRRAVRRRLTLPTYPFERQRFWVEAAADVAVTHAEVAMAEVVEVSSPESMLPALGDAGVLAEQHQFAAVIALNRHDQLLARIRAMFADFSGLRLTSDDDETNFMELGLDSLMLTQVALHLKKKFSIPITFRQLMGDCATLERLAAMLDRELPAEPLVVETVAAACAVPSIPPVATGPVSVPPQPLVCAAGPDVDGGYVRRLIEQQMQLMAAHVALLTATGLATAPAQVDVATLPSEPLVVEVDSPVASDELPPDLPAEVPPLAARATMDAACPVIPGARLGREPDGQPAWFVADPSRPERFLKLKVVA